MTFTNTHLLQLQRLSCEVRTKLVEVRHDGELVWDGKEDHVGGFQDFGDTQAGRGVERLQKSGDIWKERR